MGAFGVGVRTGQVSQLLSPTKEPFQPRRDKLRPAVPEGGVSGDGTFEGRMPMAFQGILAQALPSYGVRAASGIENRPV